jgi:hypothetical protein
LCPVSIRGRESRRFGVEGVGCVCPRSAISDERLDYVGLAGS